MQMKWILLPRKKRHFLRKECHHLPLIQLELKGIISLIPC